MNSRDIEAWAKANAEQLADFQALGRERRREVATAAIEAAVNAGIHPSSLPPPGYERAENRRLVPGRYASVITEAFKCKAAGASWAEVALLLNKNEMPTERGGMWTADVARKLLSNRVYLGEAYAGAFVKPRAHKALTTLKIFQACQSKVSLRTGYTELGPSLLSGLLRCAGCRYLMKPDTQIAKGGRVRMYRCRGHFSGGSCEDRASVLGYVIEPEVAEHLVRYITLAQGSGAQDEALHEIEAARRELEVFQSDPFVISTLGIEGLRAGIEARQRRLAEAEAALAAMPVLGMSTRGLRAHWAGLGIENQRELLAGAYGAIFLRSGRNEDISSRLLYFGVGDVPPVPSRRGPVEPITPLDWKAATKQALRGQM